MPHTGRKHQIRRHMKHVFHPVIGDTSHGDGRHNRFFREHLHCRRLLLAATRLEFAHPYSGAPVAIAAPLDAAFLAVVEHLGWRDALPHDGGSRFTASPSQKAPTNKTTTTAEPQTNPAHPVARIPAPRRHSPACAEA